MDQFSGSGQGDSSERITQALASRVRPLLQGVEVREIPSDSDVGYIVIAVPRSPDAPHAVSDSQKGKGLHYPVRVGRTTHYLSEYEVAVRYRDRYASRVEVATALDRVHEDGLAHVATWVSPWLAVSLTPVVAAERGIGAAAINAEKQFLSEWAASKPIVGPASFSLDDRIVPGIRRVIVTQTPQYRGRSKELHAELHYNGAGFGTSNDASPPPVERLSNAPPYMVEQDGMEIGLLNLAWIHGRGVLWVVQA